MATIENRKSKKADLAVKLVGGTQKHLATVATLMIASGTPTPAQAEAQLQRIKTLRAEVEAAQAVVKAKLAAERSELPALMAFQDAFVAFVRVAFANSPDVLADFGVAPRKKATPLTVEQQALAKAKRAATRKARGTMGSRQKKSVKGAVTGVTITPITSASPASEGG